jgi:hypothetical protein
MSVYKRGVDFTSYGKGAKIIKSNEANIAIKKMFLINGRDMNDSK